MRIPVRVALFLMTLVLAACGSRGDLASKTPAQSAQIKDFDQVVVLDFNANDMRVAENAEEKTERQKNIDEGRLLFSETIAELIIATKAFSTVSRKPLPGKVLVISGTVDVWEPGNIATRAVTGFIGQSHFASTIMVLDGQTGEELARMNGDRNSWPLPIGASTTIVQTVTFFMYEAANHLAAELAAAKGAKPAQYSRLDQDRM